MMINTARLKSYEICVPLRVQLIWCGWTESTGQVGLHSGTQRKHVGKLRRESSSIFFLLMTMVIRRTSQSAEDAVKLLIDSYPLLGKRDCYRASLPLGSGCRSRFLSCHN
jgi:hypothetical protein